MKLFGNKRGASWLRKKGKGAGSGSVGPFRLTGVQKGLLLLAGSFLILIGTVIAVYQSFVRPPEISTEPVQPETITRPQMQEEIFVPPTRVEVQIQVDEQTGEQTAVEVEVPASHKEGFYNILIVGTDEDGTRTDTIMIARLDSAAHSVALLSIPRDTLIDGSYAIPKINGVYGSAGKGESGIRALQTQLARLLGFEVDGYVIVNLDAFVSLVDLVGGVEFDVPMDMDYEDPSQDLYIHLKAGRQLLDGVQAMQLVRYRKGYATQDIQRTKVQQQFLRALAEKCLSVVNLPKVGDMAEIVLENVVTDLSLGNAAYFGQELLKCDFEEMVTYTLEGEAVTVNGASCYAIYQNKTLSAVNAYFNPYEMQITAEHVSIRTPEQIHAEQAVLEEELPPQEQIPEILPEEGETVFIPPEDLWG